MLKVYIELGIFMVGLVLIGGNWLMSVVIGSVGIF